MARRDVRNVSTKDLQANSNALRVCPFCGGEASVQTTYGYGVSEAFCLDCGAHTGHPPGGCTEAEAVAAWNARAERTCRIVTDGHGWWECDECGGTIDWDSCDVNDPPACAYCPNCGARVIGTEVGE